MLLSTRRSHGLLLSSSSDLLLSPFTPPFVRWYWAGQAGKKRALRSRSLAFSLHPLSFRPFSLYTLPPGALSPSPCPHPLPCFGTVCCGCTVGRVRWCTSACLAGASRNNTFAVLVLCSLFILLSNSWVIHLSSLMGPNPCMCLFLALESRNVTDVICFVTSLMCCCSYWLLEEQQVDVWRLFLLRKHAAKVIPESEYKLPACSTFLLCRNTCRDFLLLCDIC